MLVVVVVVAVLVLVLVLLLLLLLLFWLPNTEKRPDICRVASSSSI